MTLQSDAAPPAEQQVDRPAHPPQRRSWRARAFPGDRRVWIAAAVVAAVFAGIMLVSLLVPRDYYTGTNSTRFRSLVTGVDPGQRLCVSGMRIPAGTGQIEIVTAGAQQSLLRPKLAAVLTVGGRQEAARDNGPRTTGPAAMVLDIPRTAASPAFQTGKLCLRPLGSTVLIGGVPGLFAGDKPLRLNGAEVDSRMSLWYRPPAGERASVLSAVPAIFRRAALFRPGWMGAWTYWLIFLAGLPALIYCAVWLLARARTLTVRRIALTVGALVFLNAAAWALITPAFQAPDESEHYAYAQYFAETGKAIGSGTSSSVYSTDELFALDATRVLTANELANAKPPWNPVAQQEWRRRVSAARPVPRDDGGAAAAATSAHSPLYYALLAPAYWAASGGSIFDQLTAMRLTSAIMGAIVAICAFGMVLELLPRRRVIAVAAGLLVGFEPMFGFMSGVVSNDSGVNMAAAVTLYLLVRAVRRGLTIPLALAAGASLAIVPIMKGTGYAVYPGAFCAVLALLVLRRSWSTVLRVALMLAGLAATYGIWAALASSFHRSVVTTPTGQLPGQGLPALQQPGGFLVYLWEVFLPRLPFMEPHWIQSWPAFGIYGVRGWASFGWYAQTFDNWVYDVIVGAMLLVAALAIAALIRHRARIAGFVPAILVLGAALAANIVGVHAAYYTMIPRPPENTPEMGRYAFISITALAMIVVAALYALRPRWRLPVAVGLATAVMMTGFAGQMTEISRFYFT